MSAICVVMPVVLVVAMLLMGCRFQFTAFSNARVASTPYERFVDLFRCPNGPGVAIVHI